MKRIKFRKGEQRKFLKKVLEELDCPSLRAINQFGFGIPYSTLKSYFCENRTLPDGFFHDLCYLSKVDFEKLDVEYLDENYGRVLGGKKSKK